MDTATSQPLADRPTNTHLASTVSDKKGDLSMDYHRQVLQGKLESADKCVVPTIGRKAMRID
jgi:hypothetical protein